MKLKTRAQAKLIYISLAGEEPPSAYRVWKELGKLGWNVSCRTVNTWLKESRSNWEDDRREIIERGNLKVSEELIKGKVDDKLGEITSLADIREYLLKQLQATDTKSAEGVTKAIIELEKALKDKTTSFTPPTCLTIFVSQMTQDALKEVSPPSDTGKAEISPVIKDKGDRQKVSNDTRPQLDKPVILLGYDKPIKEKMNTIEGEGGTKT